MVWQPKKEEAIGIQTLWTLEVTSEEKAGLPHTMLLLKLVDTDRVQ